MGWTSNPALQALTSGLGSVSPTDTSASDEFYGNLFRRLHKGKDVSGITAFQPIIQAGQSQQRMAGESAGYGDAGLIGGAGSPEQKALLDRQAQIASDRAGEQTAQNVADATPGFIQAGSQYGMEQAANQNAFNMGKFQTAADMTNANSQYRTSPWLGMLQGAIGGATRFI